MKKMQSFLQNLFFTERSIPLIFLIAAILGFGLLALKLGFYQDDWPYVYYAFNKGIPSLAYRGNLDEMVDRDDAMVFVQTSLAGAYSPSYFCNSVVYHSSVLPHPAIRGEFHFVLDGISTVCSQPMAHGKKCN